MGAYEWVSVERYVCIVVQVSVDGCECEREKERGSENINDASSDFFFPQNATIDGPLRHPPWLPQKCQPSSKRPMAHQLPE